MLDTCFRYGMKLYCLCESDSGYVLNMKLYTGKEADGQRQTDHGPKVVKHLTEGYLEKGHTIFTDSFFSTAELAHLLKEKGTSFVGTVLKHRKGNPPDISGKAMKIKKGSTVVRQKDNLVAVRYHDRKDVMLLSTKYTAEPVDTGKETRLTR